jgi:ankyrin repeat protein
MTRECHVRFCEGFLGKFRRSTHHIKIIVKSASIAILMLGLSQAAWAMENPANEDLIKAACTGDLSAVQGALSRGANINCTSGFSAYAPLHWASMNGHREIIKLLLDAV